MKIAAAVNAALLYLTAIFSKSALESGVWLIAATCYVVVYAIYDAKEEENQ